MVLWNGFVNDARVLREAHTVCQDGANVQITAVLTPARLVRTENICEGICVERVARHVPVLSRALLAPRQVLRRFRSLLARIMSVKSRVIRSGPVRWWQIDRRLTLFVEEVGINFRMFRSVCRFRPDVVHAHDVNTLIPAWLAARRCGAKLIYDAHEISADREGYKGRVWLIKIVERLVGRNADGLITTTQARADWFARSYGYQNVVVLQNRPVERIVNNVDLIRKRLDLSEDQVVVLYQGGLQWGRGLRNLVQAVAGISKAELVLIGDGIQRKSLETFAEELPARVHFVGQVSLEELPEWTASADIGVQCLRNTCLNHFTTDSNKLFEYVMGGLPVVASDFPEIRSLVTEWDLGFLVDPDNISSLRQAIETLVRDKDMRSKYSRNARAARKSLNWASQSNELSKLYKRVLVDE